MIQQVFQNGKTEIKIETAESLEDAEKNGFAAGVYNKYYIDGKQVESYMDIVKEIVKSTKENRFDIPSGEELAARQREFVEKQAEELQSGFDEIIADYKRQGVPEDTINNISQYAQRILDAGSKLDIAGVRVRQ